MLNLILVEAALEIVPSSIRDHPSVVNNAAKRGKRPNEILLDRSLHHAAMKSLPKADKRGRPDIIHFCLLEALGSPLNMEGRLRTWVNTVGGLTIAVSPEARLPRDCNRFNGLIEQLFHHGRVPPQDREPLLAITPMDLSGLIEKVEPTRTIALTSHGRQTSLEDVCGRLRDKPNPTVFIGAYPSGPMEEKTLSLADEALSIYPKALEAWVVTSRLIYEFERTEAS